MPPKHDKPLKLRGYKLSDETVEMIQAIAENLTQAMGVQVSMTDAIRIAIRDKAESLGIKMKKRK